MMIILLAALLLSGCATKQADNEQYIYANPSARKECLNYDDGHRCTQYMRRGPVRE